MAAFSPVQRRVTQLVLDNSVSSALTESTQAINDVTIRDISCQDHHTQCYAPPNNLDGFEKDSLKEQLQDLVDKIPHHEITIVMGDMIDNNRWRLG